MNTITKEFIENLGWVKTSDWANRDIYSIGGFHVMEHNHDWYICRSDDMYYIENPDRDMMKEFTMIVRNIHNCKTDAANHTLLEYDRMMGMLWDFYDRYGEEHDTGR